MLPSNKRKTNDLDVSEDVDSKPARNNFLEGFREDGEELPELKISGKAKSRFGVSEHRGSERLGMGSEKPMSANSNFTSKGKENVIHTADRFIVSEENPGYQLPFKFTEEEIKEAFEMLDMHKVGYITKDEIGFFLDIMEDIASEQELEEMVRMLDIEGTKKVYYEQFHRMATGKSLSPIGIAYPPTIPMLQKQNINKLSNVDLVAKMKTGGDQVEFIKDKNPKDDQNQLNKRGLMDKVPKDSNQRKNEIAQREKQIRSIMEETKLDIGKAIQRAKLKKLKEIKECSVKMFAVIVDREEDDKTKRIFDSLCPAGRPYFDVR